MFDTLAKPRPSRDLNMIPLINIVLLLLIFFLIAGQLANTQAPEIRLPVSDSAKPIERHEIILALDTHLWLNGEQIALDALGTALQAAMSEDTQTIVLQADRDVTAVSLDGVLDVLRAQGITTVTLYSLKADTA